MTFATDISTTRLVAAAGAALSLAFVTAAIAGTEVSGSASHGGNSTPVTWTFDTGADVTVVSQANANGMGLMTDADGDGTPDAAAGSITVNGTVKMWCFNGVTVTADSSAGQTCSSEETVYVAADAGNFLAGTNLLGEPWQQDVDACYRAKGKETSWPWTPPPAPTPTVTGTSVWDAITEFFRNVFTVVLENSGASADVQMTAALGSDYTIIPASVAQSLGVRVTGRVNLMLAEPGLYGALATASLNTTGQVHFNIGTIGGFALGLDTPGYPVQVLISNDGNGAFGVMGNNLLKYQAGGDSIDFRSANEEGLPVLFVSPGTRCPGDVTYDGVVDFADLERILDVWGCTTEGVEAGAEAPEDMGPDIDHSGAIDFGDINILIDRWGTACPTPTQP